MCYYNLFPLFSFQIGHHLMLWKEPMWENNRRTPWISLIIKTKCSIHLAFNSWIASLGRTTRWVENGLEVLQESERWECLMEPFDCVCVCMTTQAVPLRLQTTCTDTCTPTLCAMIALITSNTFYFNTNQVVFLPLSLANASCVRREFTYFFEGVRRIISHAHRPVNWSLKRKAEECCLCPCLWLLYQNMLTYNIYQAGSLPPDSAGLCAPEYSWIHECAKTKTRQPHRTLLLIPAPNVQSSEPETETVIRGRI